MQLKNAGLSLPSNYIVTNVYGKVPSYNANRKLLSAAEAPDAFFTISDRQCFGLLQAAGSLFLNIPVQLGAIGFANGFSPS